MGSLFSNRNFEVLVHEQNENLNVFKKISLSIYGARSYLIANRFIKDYASLEHVVLTPL